MSLTPLWAALSFLTRLVPARVFSSEDMAESPLWFPVVGLLLGAVASLPVALAYFCAPTPDAMRNPALLAFLFIVVQFWATRGLHWDGLADCFDAWGSGKSGEEFQRILKDSRVGTFGVMGIVMVFTAQLLGLHGVISALPEQPPAMLGVLFLAPALGRAAMLVLPAFLPPHPVSTLGRIVAPGCTACRATGWCLILFILWGWLCGPMSLCLLAVLTVATLTSLGRLARREGGFNGDFLGCVCMVVETAALLAATLT